MFRQSVPVELHRCHCLVNDVGVGVQLPLLTCRASPTIAEPETAGLTVFVGPFVEPTTSVGSDVAEALPSAFDAVTTTRTAWPTSPLTSTYVLLVAPVMSPQPVPSLAHRRH